MERVELVWFIAFFCPNMHVWLTDFAANLFKFQTYRTRQFLCTSPCRRYRRHLRQQFQWFRTCSFVYLCYFFCTFFTIFLKRCMFLFATLTFFIFSFGKNNFLMECLCNNSFLLLVIDDCFIFKSWFVESVTSLVWLYALSSINNCVYLWVSLACLSSLLTIDVI